MLVNNNRVYSSKLACSLSPCPTLGSRWCNVTAQFQHLPSLSKTGPGVLRGPGRVRNVVVCDTLATELWEQNTAPLIPAQSCGVRWGRTSGAWCWCQPLLRTLSCLLGSSPDWHGHLGRPGHVLWMIERWKTTTVIDRHFFSYFAAFFRLNCLNQYRSHRRPYLLHCCAVLPHQSEGGVFKSRGSSLLHRAVPCCSPR